MTVLTQVSTKSARRPEIDSYPPLVIPRGPSNAKLALLAAAITFVAITGAILFLRSRKPDDAVASPSPPTNVEPGAAPAGEPAARPSEPATPPPAKAQAVQQPEARQPENLAEGTPPSSESPPPVMKVSTPPGASSSHSHPVPKRELQRRPRRQVTSNDPLASRETSRLNATAPSSTAAPTPPPAPVAEATRPAPPPAPDPLPRPAARAAPESAPAVVSRPASAASQPGFIDSKAVTAVVRAHATEVQGCFDRALMEHSDLHGRLTVRASVDPNGHVLGVTPTAVMPGGGRLQACVVEAFGHWTFPPPSGGVKGTVTYSFTFE
jgi:outer membrane biosynthesis protein TonB